MDNAVSESFGIFDPAPLRNGSVAGWGGVAVGGRAFEDASVTVKRPRPGSDEADTAAPSFEAIYREHRGRLFAVVRSVVGDSDELEDVLQLVFLEVHRCLPRFEGRSRLTTWLHRIAVNVALQHLRKRRRKRWLVLGPTGEEEQRQVSAVSDESRAEDRQILAEVQRSLGSLSEKKRVVWQLHELQGLEPAEIGEILGIPMNTVRSRLLAARKELLDDLERRGVVRPRDAAMVEVGAQMQARRGRP